MSQIQKEKEKGKTEKKHMKFDRKIKHVGKRKR